MEHWIRGIPFRVYTKHQYGLLTCCCLADFSKTVLFTISSQKGSSSFVSLVGFTSVAWALIADLCIFNETIPSMELFGGSIILIVTIAMSAHKIMQGKKEEKKEVQIC